MTAVDYGKRLPLNIKSPDDTYNFRSVQESGEVWFYGIVTKTDQLGGKQIGEKYLDDLAAIMQAVDKSSKPWTWSVKRGPELLMIDEFLDRRTQWQALIQSTLQTIQKLEGN